MTLRTGSRWAPWALALTLLATPAWGGRAPASPGVSAAPSPARLAERLEARGHSPEVARLQTRDLDRLGRTLLAERAEEAPREGGVILLIAIGLLLTAAGVAVVWWLHVTGHLHWFHVCGPECAPPPPPAHTPPGREARDPAPSEPTPEN